MLENPNMRFGTQNAEIKHDSRRTLLIMGISRVVSPGGVDKFERSSAVPGRLHGKGGWGKLALLSAKPRHILSVQKVTRQTMEDAMISRWAGSRSGVAQAASAEKLHDLARRCRELAELTAVPEVTNELERIAKALEEEAGEGERDR